MISTASRNRKLNIFISFSKNDIEFVDKLIEGLERDGRFELFIDPDLGTSADGWRARVGSLIENADTLAFVLSPESARSKSCLQELEYALEMSKRIVPILLQPIGGTELHPQMAAFNQVRFDSNRSFGEALRELLTSLSAGSDWLLEHTRLFVRARKWETAERSEDHLLTGDEIIAAKTWTFERPKDAPKPTDLHLAFISASETIGAARKYAAQEPSLELAKPQEPAHLQEVKNAKQSHWLKGVIGPIFARFSA